MLTHVLSPPPESNAHGAGTCPLVQSRPEGQTHCRGNVQVHAARTALEGPGGLATAGDPSGAEWRHKATSSWGVTGTCACGRRGHGPASGTPSFLAFSMRPTTCARKTAPMEKAGAACGARGTRRWRGGGGCSGFSAVWVSWVFTFVKTQRGFVEIWTFYF